MVAEKIPVNAAIVRCGLSTAKLASKLRIALKPAIKWIGAMQNAVMHCVSMQDLFDLSESMLVNWTVMADHSFRLIAYTQHIDTDDEVCLALVEHGCHDAQTTQRLLMEHSLVLRANRDEQGYSPERPALKYPSIAHTFVRGGREAEHVLQLENKTPLTRYRRELFKQFIVYVELLAKLHEQQGSGVTAPHDELLFLISDYGGDVNTRRCLHLAQSTGVSLDRSFMLGFAEFSLKTKNMLEGAASFFERSITGCFAAAKGDRLIVFAHARSANAKENVQSSLQAVESYLEKHNGRLFLSSPCYEFGDLPTAYRQSEMASLLDERVLEGRVVLFEDVFVEWMMIDTEHDDSLVSHCINQRPFGRILREEKPAVVDMLEAYLEGERRATPVGEKLGVHRNSLLYQMNRIEREYGVSFDDPSTCFEFRYLFRFRKLVPNRLGLSG